MINITTTNIKFKDLINALSKVLSTNFKDYSIYIEDVEQNMKVPAFHINVLPVSSSNFNIYYREQLVLVDITFFSSKWLSKRVKKENLEMANKLQEVLNTDLQVLDRRLNIKKVEQNIVENVLHTTFELVWYNINEVTQAYIESLDIMQVVYINIELENLCVVITSDDKIYKQSQGNYYILCDAEESQKILKEVENATT